MNLVHAVRYAVPIIFIIGSMVYAVMIYNLPPASLGEPEAPSYFPWFVFAGIFIFSIIDLVKIRTENYQDNEELKILVEPSSIKLILIILGCCLGYTLLFEILGYLISTLLFIGALLFYLNGFKTWKMNIIVAVVVSFSTWYSFTQLLDITLP